jgi:hypothetical protein
MRPTSDRARKTRNISLASSTAVGKSNLSIAPIA